jgi:GNAT superfamily N-acetyltransferase
MGKYILERVETAHQKREFLDMPKQIYNGNRYWVCPLDEDIESRFDPARNEQFVGGDAIRWLLRDEAGRVVGRIAAFYNTDVANHKDNLQPTGGCGFFECINDQEAADTMFDAARDWLKERGMEAMDGPVNFGDRDQWWGLLVDGFQLQPLYANPYNPEYYKDLFENYGFKNYFNQYTYYRNLAAGEFNPSVYERVKRLKETPGYRFEHIRKRNLAQVADDFRLVYNKAWALTPGVKPMDEHHSTKLMNTLKPIIDEKLIYFAYFNDEPIGFYIMVPDLNRVIGRFGGKFNLINKVRLMLMLKFTHKADRVFGLIFGVVPEFHGKGIESGIIHEFEQAVGRGEVKKYKTMELAWVGDFNPVMMRMVESYVCAQRYKTHVTYRYLFDRTKEFTRCPRLGGRKEK